MKVPDMNRMKLWNDVRKFSAAARAAGLVTAVIAVLGLSACAVNYDLTLMPRDSGKLTYGSARTLGNGEASVSIAVGDTIYTGNWVQVTPVQSASYVGASYWGWRGWGPYGEVDRTVGDTVAKALLQSSDGRGMRCDFYGLSGGKGSGKCTDDKGLVYDVQIRARG
jgi:hypothetical protein